MSIDSGPVATDASDHHSTTAEHVPNCCRRSVQEIKEKLNILALFPCTLSFTLTPLHSTPHENGLVRVLLAVQQPSCLLLGKRQLLQTNMRTGSKTIENSTSKETRGKKDENIWQTFYVPVHHISQRRGGRPLTTSKDRCVCSIDFCISLHRIERNSIKRQKELWDERAIKHALPFPSASNKI